MRQPPPQSNKTKRMHEGRTWHENPTSFTKPNAFPYPFELFTKSLLRTPSSGTCKTHSRLKTEIISHRGWWQNLKLQQTLWTSSLIDLLLEYNTHTHTHTHTVATSIEYETKLQGKKRHTCIWSKREGPYFCLGTTEKHKLQSWEQQWVPKSTNKWSSEHR
jgi:hypothetical protein